MCFIFLFTWLTSVFFLTFEEEKKIPADAGERRRKSLVVVVHKMLQREIVDGEISLGETASCFVMHFWFDQCYYQSLKKWIRRQHESQSWVSLQIRVSRGILRTFGPPSGTPPVGLWSSFFLFLSNPSSFPLCCVVLLLFGRRDEFAKSGHVSRSLCAFGMNKLTCTLTGRLRPN